jgi:hypothetical protein
MNFLTRFFGSRPRRTPAPAGGRTATCPKIDTTAIICDYPEFLVGIEADDLKYLVTKLISKTAPALRGPDDVSVETVLRYLAGDVGTDVERRFGAPAHRQMIVSGTPEVTFSFGFPQAEKPFEFQQALAALVADRWRYWTGEYSDSLEKHKALRGPQR